MDAFLDMLPASYMDHPDGFVFEDIGKAGAPAIAIRTGKVAARALRGMRRSIAALAAEGNNLIVDDVMLDLPEPLTSKCVTRPRFKVPPKGLSFCPLGKRYIGYQSPRLKFRSVERFSSIVLVNPLLKICGHAYVAVLVLGKTFNEVDVVH